MSIVQHGYPRYHACRRPQPVDWSNLPEWIKLTVAGSLSAIGTIVAGWFVMKSDAQRVRSVDRNQFTAQTLERLAHLEGQLGLTLQNLAEERRHSDARIVAQTARYRIALRRRDERILQLTREIDDKRRKLSQAFERIEQIEKAIAK